MLKKLKIKRSYKQIKHIAFSIEKKTWRNIYIMDTFPTSTIDTTSFNISNNKSGGIIVILVIIVILLIFSSLGGSSENSSSIFLSIIIWLLAILFVVNLIEYLFNIDITTSFNNFYTTSPEIDIDINELSSPTPISPIPEIRDEKQVFNIPDNTYTYKDAKAVCNAYGSKLANYSQVEEAYNNGAEWCSYGWSDDQMILFPTQQKTYDKLQCMPGHEHDCGRPGINGGYIANPRAKFGVNCYGYKPEITSEEQEMMRNTSSFPKTMKEIAFENRVDYWKNRLTSILVSPFNKNQWSE
jgi:hypothetical protein